MKTTKGIIFLRFTLASFIVLLLLAAVGYNSAQANSQVKIVGPAGSGYFGASVVALSNGNIVVTDPYYDDGAKQDVGAVYLYNGATRELISTLKGSTAFDKVGYIVSALPSGNFLVRSILWNNNGKSGAGAVTWVNGTTGLNGVVSASNSLVGSSTNDYIGNSLTILSNGNYVLYSMNWDNGGLTNVGHATWGDGNTGVSGVVSAANSLVGTASDNGVGENVVALTNGNYVVSSTYWDNGGNTNAGAVTWGDGMTGITGPVTTANSMYGSTSNDRIGNFGIVPLTNGNYVVQSPYWFNTILMRSNAGAVTWGNGATGTTGAVSTSNSLVGDQVNSNIGSEVTALSNGNYVVGSWLRDNGVIPDAGAITWGNGSTGTTGIVSAANSMVGTQANDYIGSTIAALTNGNYVAMSTAWDDGVIPDAGAITWGNGSTGT
ncbi:MAG TPA: hypothetical protein PK414_11675, partial [Anaerolineales bacterium]|nr:hypothetical protein [Anaerolineales bacterium]